MKKVIVWFRNDLRIRDNETLFRACGDGNQILPVYILDERLLTSTELDFQRAGSLRLQFLLESLADLKKSLQLLGADLIIRIGNPAEILSSMAEELKDDIIHYCYN